MTAEPTEASEGALGSRLHEVSYRRGDFLLRSGARASEYFDKYQFESDPALLRATAEAMVPMVPPDTELLAGLELGGVPVATALSLATGLSVVFVRKKAKDYGTCRLAEGTDIEGRRLLVVEDVVTSGGQIRLSTAELRDRGADVGHALCVVDREMGGPVALAAVEVTLHSLFRWSQLSR